MRPRLLEGYVTCFIALTCLALGFLTVSGFAQSPSDLAREGSVAKLNLAPLRREGAKRFPGLNQEQLRSLTLDSFDSVFYHKVNRSRLRIRPRPALVQKQICILINAFDELREAVDDGATVIVDRGGAKERMQIVHRIEADASRIHKVFGTFFLETRNSSLSVSLPVPSDDFGQFVLFLQTTRQLVSRLSDEINNYFFDTRPGVVEVADLNDHYSISVVTDVLVKLSEAVERRHDETLSQLRDNGDSRRPF